MESRRRKAGPSPWRSDPCEGLGKIKIYAAGYIIFPAVIFGRRGCIEPLKILFYAEEVIYMENTTNLTDIPTLRDRARRHIQEGAVTEGYAADRETVLKLLNEAL